MLHLPLPAVLFEMHKVPGGLVIHRSFHGAQLTEGEHL